MTTSRYKRPLGDYVGAIVVSMLAVLLLALCVWSVAVIFSPDYREYGYVVR